MVDDVKWVEGATDQKGQLMAIYVAQAVIHLDIRHHQS